MNPILHVKLHFAHERNTQRLLSRNLRSTAETSVEKISALIEDLRAVLRYYKSTPKIIKNILVDVNYNDIIAKSNRIQRLLKPEREKVNDLIVGARFSDAPIGEENHIITYYVDVNTIDKTIRELEVTSDFLSKKLQGKATAKNFNKPGCNINYEGFPLKEDALRNIIVDCSVVDSFSVPAIATAPDKETFLVTFFHTELSLASILEKLNIDDIKFRYSFFGDDTISVTRELYSLLNERIPYLISMVSSDLSKVTLDIIGERQKNNDIKIPAPTNEPTIGVIDTLFSENVYFSEWVENIDYLDTIEQSIAKDVQREHGTEVTSIIVDGPRLNPWLEDGCGRFRVRHFGVCVERISTLRLVRKIKEIVTKNPDIHVWNLSLGTDDEISRNFMSFDAAVLDELQSQKNIIFIISGTNDNREERPDRIQIGSPADSLNSIVVNSVRRNGQPATYSRKGNVLSFFNKPDVAYYGGDFDERIIAFSPTYGEELVYGTSFAAPWISRKMCYLIDIMGVPREIAKALIIDSAAGWDYKKSTYKQKDLIGYGIVPININDVLTSASEEIKIIIYGTSESYRTTNYAIPVPRNEENKYPYIARAVLCYFPECSRQQGVDYTNRELSLQFGRIKSNGKIDDINDNIQDDESHVDERQSRKEFRKWENTKFISKILKNNRPIKSYEERLWGLVVTSKERLTGRTGKGLNFGIVITLREVNGINRIQDFIRACTLRGWIVTELNVQNQVDVYNANQEEIDLE